MRDVRVLQGEAGADSTNGNGLVPHEAALAEGEIGLYQLVEAFTTLRHEINLQTRSARGLEDQTKSLLPALEQAIGALKSIAPKEGQAAWNAGKPLALALAELDEALERGRGQTERAVASLLIEPDTLLLTGLDEYHARQTWVTRLLHGWYYRQLRDQLTALSPQSEQARVNRRSILQALLDGYRIIQKRLSQVMQSAGITRIRTKGQPVDAAQMVVVEVVEADDVPAETVCDEIRAGYLWKGRLLRSAEVRATRSSIDCVDDSLAAFADFTDS
jgi:molecular chaperone GrpE